MSEKIEDAETQKLYLTFYDELLEGGVSKRTAGMLLRLFRHVCGDSSLTRSEMAQWRGKGILDQEGKLILYKGESVTDYALWLIFAGVWEGHIERVAPPGPPSR